MTRADAPRPADAAGWGLALAAAAFVCWGLSSPLLKMLLGAFPPLTLLALRFLLALAFLAPFLDRGRWAAAFGLLRTPRVVLLLAFGTGVHFLVFLGAVQRVEPAYATLGFFTAPLWTAALARLVLKERLGRSFLPALLGLLVGGVLAVLGPAGGLRAGADALGIALAVLSGLTWAVYATGLRATAPSLRLRPLMAASFLTGGVLFSVAALAAERPWETLPAADGAAWRLVLLLAAIPTTASLVLFNAALQRAPAAHVNLLLGLELASTVLFSWLLVDQRFAPLQLAGIALVLVAVTAHLVAHGLATRRIPEAI